MSNTPTQQEIDEVNAKYPGFCFYAAMTEREKEVKNYAVKQAFKSIPGEGDKSEFVTFAKGLHDHVRSKERKNA